MAGQDRLAANQPRRRDVPARAPHDPKLIHVLHGAWTSGWHDDQGIDLQRGGKGAGFAKHIAGPDVSRRDAAQADGDPAARTDLPDVDAMDLDPPEADPPPGGLQDRLAAGPEGTALQRARDDGPGACQGEGSIDRQKRPGAVLGSRPLSAKVFH